MMVRDGSNGAATYLCGGCWARFRPPGKWRAMVTFLVCCSRCEYVE